NEVLRYAAMTFAEKIDPARAISYAQEIPDASCRLSVLREAAVAQAKAGDIVGARRTVGLMRWPEEHVKLEPWQEIAATQLRAGDRKAAEGTLREALAALKQIRTWDHQGNYLWREVQFLVNYAVAQGQAGDREGATATLARVEKLL